MAELEFEFQQSSSEVEYTVLLLPLSKQKLNTYPDVKNQFTEKDPDTGKY